MKMPELAPMASQAASDIVMKLAECWLKEGAAWRTPDDQGSSIATVSYYLSRAIEAAAKGYAITYGDAVRDACAKVCDARASEEVGMAYAGIAEDCAAAIRSND
jgi:hypothetical protein